MENETHFCEKCQNLTRLHFKKNGNVRKLIHYCVTCNHEHEIEAEGKCIYTISFEDYDKSQLINHNPYISHDVTLPTIRGNTNIVCPNPECPCAKQQMESSVKYIKYNSENMEYLYICEHCGMKWKNQSEC